MNTHLLVFSMLLSAVCALRVAAADYYVDASGGNDDNDGTSVETAFATVDKAFSVGGATAGNNIYLKPGDYTTDNQWGFDLKANLIGQGTTRDEVTIRSGGKYRTLRMNATAKPTVTNLTIVGCADFKADKGGAIEMSGGTLVECVIRDGTSYGNGSSNLDGGNIYMTGDSLVLNCTISGGQAKKRGGNVYLDNGTIRNCRIVGGSCENVGGNVFQYKGRIENCEITGGTAVNDGGNVRMFGAGTICDTRIAEGRITTTTGEKKGSNVYMDNGATLSRCHLKGGSNDHYDGGSLCMFSSSCSVEDVLIEGSSCGGALLGATSRLYNVTVVANAKYGIWAWSANQTLVNCLVFGNFNGETRREWTGNQPTDANAVFRNCATADGALSTTTFPTLVTVRESDFADFANGDYHPSLGSVLIDAGGADPRGAAASATDLDGKPRMSGTIDIGCYEFQKQEMSVRIDSAEKDRAWAPAVVTFSHASEHSASPENVVFSYDFGDGSERQTTKEATIAHTYENPGVYTVTITATNDCEEEAAEMVYEGYVRVASSTVYVTAGNTSAAFPYDTPETGYGALKTAIAEASDGYTLLLGEGTYGSSDQVSITKALTVKGLGTTPERVILRNTVEEPNAYYHRTLEVNNAGAWIENLTIADGCVKDENGGNLRLVSGVVSNCVIRNGRAVVSGAKGNAAGAGVSLTGAAILTHCIITNNAVEGTSANSGLAGGAVFVPYGAKNGRLSNSLIAYNRYVTSGDTEKPGAAGVRFGGDNNDTQIENNTIVSNVVEGAVSEDSAGVHCTTWYGRLRNNIIAGNYETGKGRFTSARIDIAHCTFDSNLTDVEIVDVLVEEGPVVAVPPSRTKSFVAPIDRIFMDFASGDFMIGTQSAARNKGTASGLALTPSVDLLGKPRVFGKAIDIGCYECQRRPGGFFLVR